jgi:hypothetical protein
MATELSTAEDKLKQMFGLEEKKFSRRDSPEFEKSMRKESDEDDEFYNRTIEPEKPDPNAQQLQEAAQAKSYDQLKEKLQDLYDEKQSINETLLKMAITERNASSSADKDELDTFVDANSQELIKEERRRMIDRMRQVVDEVEK